MAAFDSSMVFFSATGDRYNAVVILASRSHRLFWVYPLLASAEPSLCGAAVTFYMGRRLGEPGLEHFISKKRLANVRKRIEEKGAVALAVLDLIPPPFPFTACILAAGALEVSPLIFFVTLFFSRLLRFGVEAVLAYFYGQQIIGWLQSGTVEYIGVFLLALAVVGTAITIFQLARNTRSHRGQVDGASRCLGCVKVGITTSKRG